MAQLRNLWALTFGPVLTMTWTPPGGSALEVRFMRADLPYTLDSAVSASVVVTLEEVL